jgi:hypothetical protein
VRHITHSLLYFSPQPGKVGHVLCFVGNKTVPGDKVTRLRLHSCTAKVADTHRLDEYCLVGGKLLE